MKDTTALSKEIFSNWRLGVAARKNQLAREREDLEFQVPELQWDESARKSRGASYVSGVAIPARPILSVPKTAQPISLVKNQMQNANLGIEVTPLSPDADAETAEVKQDLYRSIERDPDSPASHGRNWAFDRGVQCGTGWYRVNTAYDETSEDPFDQKIIIERILYQEAVTIDPSATKADYSDAQWAMVTFWKPIEDFTREFPESQIAKDNQSEIGFNFRGADEIVPGWVKGDGESKSIQIGEYFKKSYTTEEIKSPDGLKKRVKVKTKLTRYLVAPGASDGLEVLDEAEWNGPDIPLIPVIGNELQPFDNERRIFGMVRPMRDSAKIYNFAATSLVERTALEPKAPFVGDIEQFEGFEEAWKQANTLNLPYLPYKSIVKAGTQLLPPPQRTQVDASAMMPSVLLLEQADQMIQSASQTPDPVLGKANKDQSGKAIQALQGQSEVSTSGFVGSFVNVTMRYEAKVVLGMMQRIYDRPGRIVQLTNIHGDQRKVMLNAPFEMQGEEPRRVPDGTPKAKKYDLSKGAYDVAVSIDKSVQSRLQEGSEQLATFIEKDPELGVILAPLFLKYQAWPGAREAAELAKEYRTMKYPDIGKSKDDQASPEEMAAQLQQSQEQIRQLTEAGNAMQQELQGKAQELQAQMQVVQAEAQARIQAEQLKAQAAMAEAQAKSQADMMLAQMEAQSKFQIEQMKQESQAQIAQMKEEAETKRLEMEQRFAALQGMVQQLNQAAEPPERQENGGSS